MVGRSCARRGRGRFERGDGGGEDGDEEVGVETAREEGRRAAFGGGDANSSVGKGRTSLSVPSKERVKGRGTHTQLDQCVSKLSAGRASWPKDLRRSTNRFPSRWTSSRQYCFFSADKALHFSAGVPSFKDDDDPGRIFLTREASTDELNPSGRGSGSRSNTPDSSNVSRRAHSFKACSSGAVSREERSVLWWMLSSAGSGKKLDQVVASTSIGSMLPPACAVLPVSITYFVKTRKREETDLA